VGATPPGDRPHQALRLTLPEPARAAAARRMDGAGPWPALMPAGAAERARYPSVASWELVLDALREALPGLRVALVGRLRRDRGSSTALDAAEVADLRAHETVALDAFDADLAEQLAVVEACDVFLAPHTGFGLAALAVGTPWRPSPAGPGSSTSSTTSPSAPSCPTPSATRASARSPRCRSATTARTGRGRRA